jgi:signal transduction histidine kinase
MHSIGRDLLWAALAMFLYGFVGQTFTARSFLFPSTVINADLFLELFGIPIQLFRASTAAVIAVFVIRALRAFELESRQRLSMANEARLAAQREALEAQRRAQAETEQLNRELQAAVQDLSTLFELSRSLASTLDRTTLMEQAINRIAGSLPRISAGMILLRERPTDPLQIVAASGYSGSTDGGGMPREQRARRVGEYVVESGHAAVGIDSRVVDLDAGRQAALSVADATASAGDPQTVGIPLEVHNRVAGCLLLSASAGAPTLTARDISLCRTVASQLSIALENANLYREVQAREALRGEMLHRVVSAQEAERQRIARELHDETGQALTALGLGLAAASESVRSDPARAAQQLTELRTLSAQAITELHELLADLRPSVLDDLGLVPALRRQVQDFGLRTNVDAQFIVEGGHRRIRPEVETVLFRIAQEALTNVAKHARAAHVVVSLAYGAEEVVLNVCDDGQGFDPDRVLAGGSRERRAWGLLGIQERVALVGGSFGIESQPGAGTTIHVRIPLRDEGADNGHD